MTSPLQQRALFWLGPLTGVAILILNGGIWLQSLWQWPLLKLTLAEFLGGDAPAWQVQFATTGLLLMNTLWLGCGAYLGVMLCLRRTIHPVAYYLCAFTLLFGGVYAKLLAAIAILLRLIGDAIRDVVH